MKYFRIHLSPDPKLIERLDKFLKSQYVYRDRTHLFEVICKNFLNNQDRKLDTQDAHKYSKEA